MSTSYTHISVWCSLHIWGFIHFIPWRDKSAQVLSGQTTRVWLMLRAHRRVWSQRIADTTHTRIRTTRVILTEMTRKTTCGTVARSPALRYARIGSSPSSSQNAVVFSQHHTHVMHTNTHIHICLTRGCDYQPVNLQKTPLHPQRVAGRTDWQRGVSSAAHLARSAADWRRRGQQSDADWLKDLPDSNTCLLLIHADAWILYSHHLSLLKKQKPSNTFEWIWWF